MNWGRIAEYGLYGMGVLAFALWSFLAVRAWAPAARKRGGHWYLEAILLIAGPLCLATEALNTANFSIVEPINRYARLLALALATFAVIRGMRNPRKDATGVLIAVAIFYLALIASGLGASSPSLPESYIYTPLIVFAFLIPGDYTYEWLLRSARLLLRTIIVLSGLSIWALPALAFLPESTPGLLNLAQFQGITGHPNTMAVIAVLGLLLEIASKSSWVWKLAFLTCVILAQSSTGYVTALVGALLLNTAGSKALRALMTAGALVLAGGQVIFPAEIAKFVSGILPQDASTLTGRTGIWTAAMKGFESNPLTGYGPELLGEGFRARYLPGFDAAAQAHNQFVQSLAGAGIIGAASLALLLLVLTIYALKGRVVSGGLGFALLALITLRGVTETTLRPTGVSFATLVIVIVIGLISFSSTRTAIPENDDQQKEPTNPEPKKFTPTPSPRANMSG